MKIVTTASSKSQCFNSNGPRIELVRVAKVDQRVAHWFGMLAVPASAKVLNLLTVGYEVVDQRFLAFKEIIAKQLFPVVPILYELIFEEINECSLVPEELSATSFISLKV